VPSVGAIFKDGGAEVELGTKLEIMPKMKWLRDICEPGVNPNDPDANCYPELDPQAKRAAVMQMKVRPVTVDWVLGGSFFYGFFDGLLAPGARLWFAYATVGDYKDSEDYSGAQMGLEPAVKTHVPFTEDKAVGMDARLGYNIPLGFHLGGKDDAFISGLRIRVGLYF